METSSYAAKLEKKLVTEFKDMFYEKMGYYPIVLVKNRTQGDGGIPVMSLDALKDVFEPFLPIINERPISLDSKLRNREIVELRCIFCYLARTMKYNLNEIGRFLGNRDHTTIIYNVNTFNNLVETNEVFRAKYFTILNYIREQHESSVMDNINQVQRQPQSDILS